MSENEHRENGVKDDAGGSGAAGVVEVQNDRTAKTDRRTLLKGIGVAGGAALTGAGAQQMGAAPVQDSEAIAPLVVAGAAVAVGAGASVGWMLRDQTAEPADAPADGLSASALQSDAYQTALTRHSTNASTFVDNKNIVEAGAPHSAYAEGKIAAIKALNEGKSQSEVETAATDAVDAYSTTLKSNLLKSWNESVRELENMLSAVDSHSSLGVSTVFQYWTADGQEQEVRRSVPTGEWDIRDGSTTLPDGSTLTVKELNPDTGTGLLDHYSPLNGLGGPYEEQWVRVEVDAADSSSVEYLQYAEWDSIWTKLDTALTNARDGIITWVSNVYSQVQQGELDTAELLTPAELAQLTASEKDSFNQAAADLMALNIPTDLKREATITISSINATLTGQLHVTGETTLEAGTTVDPSSAAEDYYLTYDVSEQSGTWDAYDDAKGVDGGVVAFTSEPYDGTEYTIHTTADETATVVTSDFTAKDTDSDGTNDTWTVDLSSQLETTIANIEKVEYAAAVDETQFETVQLRDSFTIDSFTNTETGEEKSSATVDPPSTPQDDTNYITSEQWNEMQQNQEELIEKYENATSSGGGGLAGLFGDGSIPIWVPGGALVAAIAYLLQDDE